MEKPTALDEFILPDRILQLPGPSPVPDRVSRAMTLPIVGHLDDSYLRVMKEVREGLRYVLQTENEYTFAVNGSGSAAMETAFSNLVEKGDPVLIATSGFFGDRITRMAKRAGGDVEVIESPTREPFSISAIDRAFEKYNPRIFGIVHGETSTGVVQPQLNEVVSIARDNNALTIVDGVASVGGVEFLTDEWDIDVAYAGSQKCISAPPGASPITFSERAIQKVKDRDIPPHTWYYDIQGIWDYWDDNPVYHHTGPLPLMYALREALRVIAEEGLKDRWSRHTRLVKALRNALEEMNLELFIDNAWLPSATSISVPAHVDQDVVLRRMKEEYGIEITGGLGKHSNDIFRVGCMGHSCKMENLLYFLMAFGNVLKGEGANVRVSSGLEEFVTNLDKL